MKKFLKRFSFFTIILLVFMVLVVFINNKFLNRSDYYALSENTEFLVLGHSQSEVAFNDAYIPRLENFSKSGEAYFYTFLKARKIIPNNKQIKTVFIEFENSQVHKVMDSWTWGDDRLYGQFPRYFGLMNPEEIKFLWSKNSKGIVNTSPRNFLQEIGYTYLSTLYIKKGIKSNKRFGGYFPLNKTINESDYIDGIKKKRIRNIDEVSEINLKYLSKTIELCQKNGIQVFLIRTPLHKYYPYLKNKKVYEKIRTNNYSHVEFLDFIDFPIENSEFADAGHLNSNGAKKFSIWFNRQLESGIFSKKNNIEIIDNQKYSE